MIKSWPKCLLAISCLLFISCSAASARLKKGGDEAERAKQFEARGLIAPALKFWTAAIAKNPTYLPWYLRRGRLYFQTKDYDRALADYDTILRTEPGGIEAMQMRANCLLALHQDKLALDAMNEELRLNPADGGMLLQQASFFQAKGKVAEADRARNEMKKYGFTGETLKVLADVGTPPYLKHPQAAVALLKQQIVIDPVCPDLYLALANIYQANEIHGQQPTIQACKGCYSAAPRGSWVWRLAHIIAGGSYSEKQDFENALAEYVIALSGINFERKANFPHPQTAAHVVHTGLKARAQTWAAMGKYVEAAKDLTLLIDNYAPDIEAYQARSRYYVGAHQLQKALDDITRAVELEPDVSSARIDRVNLLKQMHRYADAIADMTIMIELSPGDELLYDQRADLYALVGQPNKAIEDYTELIELDPDEPSNYKKRAVVYRKLGLEAQALADEKHSKSGSLIPVNKAQR